MPHLNTPSGTYEKKPLREGDVIACEICGALMKFEDALSLSIAYRMPGKLRQDESASYPAFQCKDWQHFGCCHEHALLAVLHCTFEHIHFGEHNQSGALLEHGKLQRIADILEEKYNEVLDGVTGDA